MSVEETAVQSIVRILKTNEVCFFASACDFKDMIEEMETPTQALDKQLEKVASEILCELEEMGMIL